MEIELNRICRSCMSFDSDMCSLFDTAEIMGGQIVLSEMLMACASLDVKLDENMPSSICLDCVNQLNNAYHFKQQCEKTDINLRNLLNLPPASSSVIVVDNNVIQLLVKQQESNKNSNNSCNNIIVDTFNECELTNDGEDSNLCEIVSDFSKNNEFHQIISNEKQYFCKICNDIFKNENLLCLHEQSHNNSPINYKSEICDKNFDHTELLKDHKIAHERESLLSDNLNGNVFNVTDELIKEEESNVLLEEIALLIEERKTQNVENVCSNYNSEDARTTFNNHHLIINLGNTSTEKEVNYETKTEDFLDDSNSINDKAVIENAITSKKRIARYTCPVCKKYFKISSSFYKHISIHKRTKLLDANQFRDKYKCRFCGKSFDSVYILNGHIMSMHRNGEIKNIREGGTCDVCNENFESSRKLLKHFQRHVSASLNFTFDKLKYESSNGWPCYMCSDKFATVAELDAHMEKHNVDSDGNFVCGMCECTFRKELALKKHLKTHGIQPFACNICLLSFETRIRLKQHADAHNQRKLKNSFKCLLCDECFFERNQLQAHITVHTADAFRCNQCGVTFNCEASFESHSKSHSLLHLCSLCGEQFRTNGKLQSHLRKHNNEKPYMCVVCNKGYSSKSVLKVHQRIHANYKPYICSYCGYSCCQSGDLQMHIRTHTGEKPYSCPFSGCDRKFTTSSQKREHIRRHTGEKNHACEICQKTFAESKTLKVHMLTHMGLRPHKCDICERTFRRKHHKLIHMKQHPN